MFATAVLPDLRSHFALKTWAERALIVHCDDEADVAEPLRRVSERHPDVYVKSLAKPFPAASQEGLRVIVATSAASQTTAERAADTTFSDLRQTLQDAGFELTTPES